MKGRKPKPTHLRLLQGNLEHRPINRDEPEPEGDLIDPPESFSPAQRILWRQTLQNCPDGMLRRLDTAIFAAFVCSYGEFLEADRKVQQMGTIVKTAGNQPMQNPYVSIRNRNKADMIKAASELGFTPSSRSRVKVPRKQGKSAFGKLKQFQL